MRLNWLSWSARLGGLFTLVASQACTPASGGKGAETPHGGQPDEKASTDDDDATRGNGAPPSETVVLDAARPFSGHRPADGKNFDEEAILTFLASADAVCVGERHDNPLDHYAQWRVIQGFAERRAIRGFELGVALEMVRSEDQPALSSYGEGALTDDEFVGASRWESEWGFPIQFYRPQLQEARAQGASLLALGVARPLTRSVAMLGIEGLSDERRREIPEIDFEVTGHRELFESLMKGHPMEPGKLDNYYEAQLVWDEKMAESAGHWLQGRQPGRKLVILAGTAHCHRTAIPARLTRRTGLSVVSVLPVDRGAPVVVSETPATADERMVSGYDYQVIFGQ